MEKSIDWDAIKKIHFVGIKGVAMAALAVWAREKGLAVTGSDIAEAFPTDTVLERAHIVPTIGFDPANVRGADVVIYTGAHGGRENPEVVWAGKNGIPVFPHGKALGEIMAKYRQISVAGCHGKTTTAAMIATILSYALKSPSWAIGSGMVAGLGSPGHFGKGEYFVAEADEYVTDPGHDHTPRFLWQHPEILVVTAIDFDHSDVYADIHAVGNAYQVLCDQKKENGLIIYNASDINNKTFLQEKQPVRTYGFADADLIVVVGQQKPLSNAGMFCLNNRQIPIRLKVPGIHNLQNAAAAFLVAEHVGIDEEIIIPALETFGGAARRFEYLGQRNGATYIDDYAHHPVEIAATIAAARAWYPTRRIIAVFQPHTFSRTASLLHDFAVCFSGASHVLIADIYTSAREKNGSITSLTLVENIQKNQPDVFYAPGKENIASWLDKQGKEGDVVVFLGAGSIGNWAKALVTETT